MRGSYKNCLRWLEENGEEGKFYEVKELRPKRSLTQNAYYWALLSELASTLRLPNEEVHRQMLRDYSTATIMACMEYVDVPRIIRYSELDSYDEEQRVKYWRIYQGSSDMDNKEFTRLLNGLIEECNQCGISTLTPEEAALLKR